MYTCTVVCDQCFKPFDRAYNLKNHYRIHTGERPYMCEQCPMTFAWKQYIKIHIKTHTGEKPYHCEECPKEFSEKVKWKKHRRTHTGEKPYSCDECDKSFSFSHNLAAHKRLHTGERPYKCERCPGAYCLGNLKTHQETHAKPLSCGLCDYKAKGKQCFNLHMHTQHEGGCLSCDSCIQYKVSLRSQRKINT